MKTLVFEGAGWEKSESGVVSGVGNCRIRTKLRNNNGRVIYLEITGWMFQGNKIPQYAKPFRVVGHVDFCYHADSEWESRQCISSDLKFSEPHFEYSKENILQLVNHTLDCSFDSMDVVNDGSVRAHDKEPLCDCSTGDYKPYSDPVIRIKELEGVTPLHTHHDCRIAKYRINYDFVREIPFVKNWLENQTQREHIKFPNGTYYVTLRWDAMGEITSAEISAYKNFPLFGIDLNTLQETMKHVKGTRRELVTPC